MEALFTSTLVVALAEIGDKTQLLAVLLAVQFRKPLTIITGILAATLANHFLAALVGSQAATFLQGDWFRYLIAVSFILMAAWTLIPDKLDEDERPRMRNGAFLTTLITFFLVEMGDKTQVATIALGAQFEQVMLVTLGTTLGMMLANTPAVFLGEKAATRLPLTWIRIAAALGFALTGLAVLFFD